MGIFSLLLGVFLFLVTPLFRPIFAFQYNVPGHPEVWEPLGDYRRRLGIEFNYTTKALHPEICRHLTQDECERKDRHARELQTRNQAIGSQKAIVLLIKTTDYDTLPREDYDHLFNSDVIDEELNPTGSIRQYYLANSYGKFDVEFLVTDWVDSPLTEEECAGTTQGVGGRIDECYEPALQALDARHADPNDSFDWTDYDQNNDFYIDNLIIIHNGYAAEAGDVDSAGTPSSNRIRSYSSSAGEGSFRSTYGYAVGYFCIAAGYRGVLNFNFMRLNIATHEFIHNFGMFDLYDLSFQSSGCGTFCIMGFPVGQANSAIMPGNVGAYTKYFMGWVDPIEITQDGVYDIRPSYTHEDIYLIRPESYDPFEYLLIENRQKLGWDLDFWGDGGIVIWHVDDSVRSNNLAVGETRVRIVQRDGNYDLESGLSKGDETDLFVDGGEVNDSGDPNLISVANGSPSGIRIYDFSPAQSTAQFTIGGMAPATPTTAPPSAAPQPDTTTPAPQQATTPAPQAASTPAPQDASTPAPQDSSTPAPLDTSTPVPQLDPTPTRQVDTPAPQDEASPAPQQDMTPAPQQAGTPAPQDDTMPTTPAPQVVTTQVPQLAPVYDLSQCTLSVGTGNCDDLLPQVTPEQGCDCYNFCAGAYAGCCAYGADCPIVCSGALVGGCVLPEPTGTPSSAPSMAPSPGPSATPSSAPTLSPSATPSGAPSPAPSNTPTTAPSVVPTPVPPPTETCLVTAGMEECSTLMATIVPTENCDCYNFCNGEPLPCCTWGPGGCPVLNCIGDFVAGCRAEDRPPTPAPVPEPVCFVQASTAECGSLVASQDPMPDCDCYDYCDGEFAGCCAYNTFCGLRCSAGVESVVAGCELSATLGPSLEGTEGPSRAPVRSSGFQHFWPDGFTAPRYEGSDNNSRLLGGEQRRAKHVR